MYSIFLSNQAKKFLSTCDSTLRERLEELFEILINDPLPVNNYDITKIKELKKGYGIRLGTTRTIIELNPKKKEIFILKIDQRATVYRDF